MRIAIVDYGIGNVKSILNAFEKKGVRPSLSNDRRTLLDADALVLPGVGAFGSAMRELQKEGLDETLKLFSRSQKPLLGICLGMQLLFERSEESEGAKGLGLIAGEVVRMRTNAKLPHIGWSGLFAKERSWQGTILEGCPEEETYYFVHTYVAQPARNDDILAYSRYGGTDFCSVIARGNVFGCQFHPEKSAAPGLKIIENFINICKENRSG